MQRTVFLFITRYEDDKVAIYKEGTEIQSLYLWRTTDELNVSRLVLQNIMHQSIPAVPIPPPPGQPQGISNCFLNGKFPGVGTSKSVKCPGVGPK